MVAGSWVLEPVTRWQCDTQAHSSPQSCSPALGRLLTASQLPPPLPLGREMFSEDMTLVLSCAIKGDRWFVAGHGKLCSEPLTPSPKQQEKRRRAEICCWLDKMLCDISSPLCPKAKCSSSRNEACFPTSSSLMAP